MLFFRQPHTSLHRLLLLLLMLSFALPVTVNAQRKKRKRLAATHRTAAVQSSSKRRTGKPPPDNPGAEKEARTLEQAKIDSQLLYALKLRRGEQVPFSDTRSITDSIKVDEQGRTLVDLNARVSDELERSIRELGGEIRSSFKQYNAIRVNFPIEKLEALAALSDIKFISPAAVPTLDKPDAAGNAVDSGRP